MSSKNFGGLTFGLEGGVEHIPLGCSALSSFVFAAMECLKCSRG